MDAFELEKLDKIISETKLRKGELRNSSRLVFICSKCPIELEWYIAPGTLFFADYSLVGTGWSIIKNIIRCPICSKKFYKDNNLK